MSEAKFKVGDRVRKVDDYPYDKRSLVGVVTTVYPPDNIASFWTYLVDWDDDNGRYIYSDDDLELIEDEEVPPPTEDPMNPTYYNTGTYQPVDIMLDLMTPEQLEGFFWGNIIKYAYRYGRKGDKVETAKKIKWYASAIEALYKVQGMEVEEE